MPMTLEDEGGLVEIIRRATELVVIVERSAAHAQEHKEKLDKAAETQQWGDDTTQEEEEVIKMIGRSADADKNILPFSNTSLSGMVCHCSLTLSPEQPLPYLWML